MKKPSKRIGRFKVRTIDVHAKEWRDKVNGNSYFACRITINYGLLSQKEIRIPLQYGYGNHYKWVCIAELGWKDSNSFQSLWRVCNECDISLRTYKEVACLKRDVIAWGSES